MNFEKWSEETVGSLIKSVSNTYKFDKKDKIVLINTSDVLEGFVTNNSYQKYDTIAGQFKKTFEKGDILFSEIRPKNKRFAYIDFDSKNYIASTKLMVLRSKNKNRLDPLYLYYYLTSNEILTVLQNIAESRSGTFPQITFTEVSQLKINLPSVLEQKSIVNFIKMLDKRIELNNRINNNLEELAQTLYKNWFVDFEFPNEEGLPYKSSGGKMVDSEIGLIPEGWEVKILNKLVKQHRIKKDPDQNRKLIDLANMPSYSLTLDRFDNGDKLKTNIYEMKTNNFIYGSIRPYLGKFGIVPYDGLTTGTIHQFNVKNKLEYSTIATIIFSKTFNDFCIKLSHGTKMPVINWNQFSSYKVIYNKVIFEKFNDITQSYYKTIVNNINENISLVEMRDLLLPKLMSGEIRVPIKE